MTIEGFGDENRALMTVFTPTRALFSSSKPSIVTQAQAIKSNSPKNFDALEEMITNKMKKHIGQITIRNNSKRESKKAKEIRENKKKAANQFKEACQTKPSDIEEIKNHYIDLQVELREQLEKDELEKRKNIAKRLIQEGGINSNLFWLVRKKIIKNDTDANYDVKDEHGNTIEDENEAKEHIAQYYEQLYQARPDIIQNKVRETENKLKSEEPIPEITPKELNKAIKCHCTIGWGIEFMGVIKTPRKIFPSKNMETYQEISNSMINLYEKTEKVTLVNPFRPPPIKSCPILPYSIVQ